MLLRAFGGARALAHKSVLPFASQAFPRQVAVRSFGFSRKGDNGDKQEDPRSVEAQELMGDMEPERTSSDPRQVFGAGMEATMPERDFRDPVVRRVDDDDAEVANLAVDLLKKEPKEPLGPEWILDREKESYYNPSTGEVKMPFWKSRTNYERRRADRYRDMTEAQDQRPLPFFADQGWDDDTQFYWSHEMTRIRRKYNDLDFDELEKILADADSRFFSNEESYNLIPFGPVVRNNEYSRGEEEAKAEEDKWSTFLLPAKYHVKDFTRTHGSSVGKKVGFGTLIIAGNRKGVAGYGYGKGSDLMQATRMASKDLVKNLIDIPLDENRTIYTGVTGKYGTTKVILERCKRGHGISAGTLIWALCDCLGIQDLTSKVYGSTHPLHVCYAFFKALVKTKSGREDALLRGQNYWNMYERGVRTLNPPTWEEQKLQDANVRRYINTAREQWTSRQGFSVDLVEEANEIEQMHGDADDVPDNIEIEI